MLAGDDAGPEGQRWLLIERESPISEEEGAGRRWSADHLFIDQDGITTVAETKRSCDPRARRDVVAQMLDSFLSAMDWAFEQPNPATDS